MDDRQRAAAGSASGTKPAFFYGYVIILACFVAAMIVYGAQYSFGVFFKPVLAEFGWTRAVTAGAYSLYIVLQGTFAIVAGRLNDRFGPRRVVAASGTIFGIGYLLMSQTGAVWHIYLFYGILASIGAAGCWVPLLSTTARWFVKKRGMMSGIIASGIGVGTTFMPPLAERLIADHGWRTSYAVFGAAALLVTVAAAQFLKRDPNEVGQVAYGADPAEMHGATPGVEGLTRRQAMRTRQFWAIMAPFFLFQFCIQTAMVHLVPHATDIGIAEAAAATLLSVIGAGSIAGKIGMGSAIDRGGSKRVMVTGGILMLAAFTWLTWASALWSLYLFAAVFALAYGAFIAVQSPVVAEYFGLRAHGEILGLLVFGAFVGGAVGPFVSGQIFDATLSYRPAFVLSAGLAVLGLVIIAALKPRKSPGTSKQ